jgi:hypothetical protein
MLDALILSTVLLQPVPSPKKFLWDYSSADIAASEVNRFELKIDDGEWGDVGRLGSPDQSGATPGYVTYEAPVPALTLGSHIVSMRACNVTDCSDPLGLVFIVSIKPAPVINLRIGGGQ